MSRLLFLFLVLSLLSTAHAFGAGNIAGISAIEGKNWRHGDIEDMLKTVVCLHGHKWTSTMIKRVYFGNWLRDYSQAMDVGTLKGLPADTIRVLVWILSFLTFGLATDEFEVTSDRLGVYRPEEHIDNPKDYADNQDARQYDDRLRPPVRQVELDIDPQTGMKNYIANERGDWATSSAYIRYSLSRSIHFGRMYTSDRKDKDLCEALRCLGQGLHTLEDFGAHTNYCELALREMGFLNVFPHTGTQTQIHLHGHYVFPLVTGTFGMVDFLHSVLGEATDHFTQSEVNEMDIALGNAESSTSSSGSLNALTGLLGKIPGTRDLVSEAEELKARSEAQEYTNRSRGIHSGYAVGESRAGPPQLPDIDPAQTVAKIYPILQFRDKVVRKLTSVIEKIPGLEAVIEKISDTLTVFIMSLLAPFVRPIINAASKSLQSGSSGVIHASGQHQYEPWTDPICTDPTHSLLSKDHFSNILNEPAGHVASAILRYVAPRVLYAWEHPTVHEEEVIQDCLSVFHHPALRNMNNEAHRNMFEAVQSWVNARNDRGANLNVILSAEGVRAGKNNTGDPDHPHGGGGGGHSHGQFPAFNSSHSPPQQQQQQQQQQGSTGPSIPWAKISKLPIPGVQNLQKLENTISSFIPGGVARDVDSASGTGIEAQLRSQSQSQQHYQSESYYTPGGSAGDYYSQQGGGGEYTYPSHSQAQAQAQTHPQMQSYPHPYPHPNVHAGNYPPAQQWQGYQYPYPHPHPLLQDTGRDADIERIP